MLQLALVLLPAASGRPVAEVAGQHRALVNGVQSLRESGPVDQLLAGHEVDIGQGQDGVEEGQEGLFAVGAVEEPGGVEEQREGSLGLGVVLQEVLGEDFLDGSGVLLVEASVGHGTSATANILQLKRNVIN